MERELNLHVLSYSGDTDQIRCLQLSQSELNETDKNGCTPLHLACFKNHSSLIKYLIDLGANVQCQDNNLTTPLHWSVYNGNKEMVQLLIDKGSAQMEDVNGIQPIHLAALIGHTQILQILLTEEITNFKDKSGATPLHLAAYCGHNDCIKILLDSGHIDINAEDNNKITSIYLAAMSNLPDTVKLLLNNGVNSDGFCSAVRWAAINGNLELLKVLISDKSPRTPWNYSGYDSCWLLFFATMYGHNEVILYLLEKGHVMFLEEGACEFYTQLTNIDGPDSIVFTNTQKLKSLPNSLYWVLSYCSKSAIEIFIDNADNGIYMDESMLLNGVTLPPLHMAASFGNCDAIKVLLERSIDVNTEDFDGSTSLQWAAAHGHLDAVKLLLEHGANTSKALCWAAAQGYVNIAKLLLEYEAEIDEVDDEAREYPQRPLITAASSAQAEMVEFLLDNGADINNTDLLHWCSANDLADTIKLILSRGVHIHSIDSCHGRTALHWAANYGHLNTAKLLIDAGIDVNIPGNMDELAIHLAVENNHSEMVKLLIDNGSKLNEAVYFGLPLCIAVRDGNLKMVKVLVEGGADINFDESKMHTPLLQAIECRNLSIVKYLIKNGAERKYMIHAAAQNCTLDELKEILKFDSNIHSKDPKGLTPLCYSARTSYENTQFLIETGVDINVMHAENHAPIYEAIYFEKFDIVKLLIDNDAILNTPTGICTPLIFAVSLENLEMIKLLIENGADPNLADKYGQTPLHYAQTTNSLQITKYLLSKHADVNARNISGETPLYWVTKEPDEYCDKTIRLLIKHGADVNAITLSGSTAISFPVQFMERNIVKLFIINGADLHLDKNILSGFYIYNQALETIKLLHLAGLQFSRINDPTYKPDDDVYNYLLRMGFEPLTLKQLSRIACRHRFGKQYHREITKAFLPYSLKRYLAFDILD